MVKPTGKQFIIVSGIIAAFAVAGIVLMLATSASTYVQSSQAESGTISLPASLFDATTASGGKAVRFGQIAGPPPANTSIIEGSFVQPWEVQGWNAAKFASEFQYMQNVKMDHLIWQWTVDSTAGKNITYYPTTMDGFRQHGSADLVGISLEEARKKGLVVWLGLNWTDNWWDKGASDPVWLTREFDIGKVAAKEMWDLYKSRYAGTIAGFYITMEVDNVNFMTATLQDRMIAVYKDSANSIHQNTGKPVMVAPFFNASTGQSATQYAATWGRIVSAAPLDVVAVQDGIGVHHATVANIGSWLSPMRNAIKDARPTTQFWSDVETFDESPADNFVPAPVSRVINQISAERQYVDKFTSYSFTHYDSPNQGHTSHYNAWKAYTDSK